MAGFGVNYVAVTTWEVVGGSELAGAEPPGRIADSTARGRSVSRRRAVSPSKSSADLFSLARWSAPPRGRSGREGEPPRSVLVPQDRALECRQDWVRMLSRGTRLRKKQRPEKEWVTGYFHDPDVAGSVSCGHHKPGAL